MNDLIFLGIVGGTLILVLVLAFIRKRTSTFTEYSSAPGEFSTFAIATSVTGTVVGGGMFIAVGQMGYEAGNSRKNEDGVA